MNKSEAVKKYGLIEFIGWYGVVAVIGAYFFVSFGLINPASWLFQFFNLTGGGGLAAIAFKKRDTQLVVVNIVWALIALFAIWAGVKVR